MTLAQWAQDWLSIGAPGRRRQAVGQRSVERYRELLRHVLPVLGTRPLQQLQASEIDRLYASLDGKVSPRTLQHMHITLSACLATAARTRKIRATRHSISPRLRVLVRLTTARCSTQSSYGR